MSMYVRIKRKQQTIFLSAEQRETVQDIKTQIGEIVGQNPADIRLYGPDKTRDMSDSASLGQQDIKSDSILYMVFRNPEGGGWEEVDTITPVTGGEMKD
ncbi:ubiquitin family protein [Nannochloropsis oceanica]